MRAFYFAGVLSQHLQPYTRVQPSGGAYDDDGEWQSATQAPLQLSGMVQPLAARLQAREGGTYLESDRMLYTTHAHAIDERIEHAGTRYRVVEATEREYSDVSQYVLRKVVAHAPLS
ncbi:MULTISPECIES: hypothetical protein [unclassified Paenibacillus]|uniref:hypothetical protein n=1 Tax=unclassified Paenibacillus TaxID=185978 RepID=UPI00095626ED|nr:MULTISPECIES: hypothetical protein [unclassified Paenibacillus]ASS66379.1 hypothetical protein CIC07_09605 [Paenibacillus sp. RUD330]SIQ06232.1 hypothetical protein SAMN05880555_0500 [Paenibacillus sp. RU4X]SIQ26362.1 hypothetical protein SAMN05880570_0499 [Paenibacillus sp. RU4T]